MSSWRNLLPIETARRRRWQATASTLAITTVLGVTTLLLAQPPTGYPDVASSWISPDMLLTRMNFVADLLSNRLPGSRVAPESLREKESFLRLVAPDGLSPATRAALAESEGSQAIALVMAAPEFQRR